MTHSQLMPEELERRNYSQNTARVYLSAIEDLGRYVNRQPDELDPEHVREYQAYLFRERKLSPNTVNQRTGALRFFFITTLRRPWTIADTPYPRRVFQLPTVLSQDDVARLINAAPNPYYRTLVMALYATGARREELARLKVSDIDSKRMVVHIHGGKGRKDRDVMLSPTLLEALRDHWRRLRRKLKTWLFPGNRWHTGDEPIDTKVIWLACKKAATRAGLKGVHPHTTAGEFRRRFLLHVLPRAFVRIRHFGFLAHRRKATLLPICFQLLQSAPEIEQSAGGPHQGAEVTVAVPVLRWTDDCDRATDSHTAPHAITSSGDNNSGMNTPSAVHLEIDLCSGISATRALWLKEPRHRPAAPSQLEFLNRLISRLQKCLHRFSSHSCVALP